MNNFQNLIIDASAGTGKTYTICEKVTERIKAGYSIKDFVIMTYTEKAAGELIYRIRKRLKEEKEKTELSDMEMKCIRDSLKDFDFATIGTIHSVCKKILKEYAFECGVSEKLNLEDTDLLAKEAYFKNCILWFYDYIETNGFSNTFVKDNLLLHKKYIKLASVFNKNDEFISDILLKEIPFILINKINNFFRKGLQDRLTYIDNMNIEKKSKKTTDELKDALKNFIKEQFDSYEKNKDALIYIIEILSSRNFPNKTDKCAKILINDLSFGFPYLDLYTFKEEKETKIYLELTKIINIQKKVFENLYKDFNYNIKNRNVMNFNMIINIVADAVEKDFPKGALFPVKDGLVRELQKRWKICIIDEFQDTSPQQWTIAESIFLKRDDKENNPHLIIVGDMKQSIYSFQGANVETYLNAKEEIIRKYNGITDTLNDNYRTNENTLKGLNEIFSAQAVTQEQL